MKTYRVNEIFYSVQGEGVRAGTANLFLRFTGCNQTCRVETHGFDCDTEFASGRDLTVDEIVSALRECRVRIADSSIASGSQDRVRTLSSSGQLVDESSGAKVRTADPTGVSDCEWIILTGGEPALQVDRALIDALHAAGFKLAIETNGSIALPDGIDWVTVSPKVAEHAIRQLTADEVKYVRGYGQAIPKTAVDAPNKLISPAFNGDGLDAKTLDWCVRLVKENPDWRLSIQMHKSWGVR